MRKVALGILALSLFFAFAACNNAANNSESATDSMAATTDHDMSSMTTTDNPLPAVPADAKVFFSNLKDGQTVSSPFKVEMGVSGMSLEPAGAVKAGSGHHHILIDAGDSLAAGTVVPSDSNHLHFGKAQSETELSLAPGKHTITLQFADGLHRSYGGQMAATVTVNVK